MINPENQQEINRKTINSLSSKEHYLYIYSQTLPSPLLHTKPCQKTPTVLVYKGNDDLPIKQLVSKFVSQTKIKDLTNACGFQLETRNIILPEMTILSMKKLLRVNNLDGVRLYPYIYNEADFNQSSMAQCISAQQLYYPGQIQIACEIKPINYPIYIHVKGTQKPQKLKKMVGAEIQRIFSRKIQNQNISVKIFDKDKQKTVQLMEIHVSGLIQKDRLQIYLNAQLPPLPKQNQSQLIIKGNDIQPVTYDYDDIKQRKLEDVLKQIDSKREWEDFGLMFGDEALKNHQKFCKFDHLFGKSAISNKHFAGILVGQAHLFELEQKKIKQKKNLFDLQSIISEQKNNLKLKQTCLKQSRKRAMTTKHQQFKNNYQSIQFMLLYSSELIVKASSKNAQNKQSSIYNVLNQFLRKQNFAKVSESEYGQWEYLFQCDLLQQLKKLKPITDKVLWRGVSYPPDHNIGDKIMYKQFLSTSTSQEIAKGFAWGAIFRISKSYSGRSITDYSLLKTQEEVLFPPYVQFQVKGISQMQINQVLTVPCFEIEQVKKEPIPVNIVRYILWVDQKTQQGKYIWSEFKQIHDTTVMVQLISNQQLNRWFEKNAEFIKDPTVEIMMISNMTRYQDKVKIDEAGVESVKIFRKYVPNGNIFIYIGWLEGTLQKLKNHNYQPSDILKVSNNQMELKEFLGRKANIK